MRPSIPVGCRSKTGRTASAGAGSAPVLPSPPPRSLCSLRFLLLAPVTAVGQSPRALSELLKQQKLQAQWKVGLALERPLQASSAIVAFQHAACASIPSGRGDAELQHSQLT